VLVGDEGSVSIGTIAITTRLSVILTIPMATIRSPQTAFSGAPAVGLVDRSRIGE
jgi:hypothetical protein